MSAIDEHKRRVISVSTERGDFVCGEDGYYVYWPAGYAGGSINPAELRILADHLDSLNAAYDKQVQDYFNNHYTR